MGKVIVGLFVSLDGYIAGPDDGLEHPLGRRRRDGSSPG